VADLLVIGLDLVTGQEVHACSRPVWEWRCKGHNGDRTLVCLDCFYGSDIDGAPRLVALVPKGRRGGVRRAHFAHPPGMGPACGHGRETIWHAKGKQRLCRWAKAHGGTAKVEAYTPDRRRRSDVAVTLADGHKVAIEVQLGEVTDAEWLARHHDYVQAGIVDVWLWYAATWVPRVVFEAGQPGWILDLENDRLGMLYARPETPAGMQRSGEQGCGEVHWPPCWGDQLGIQWMSVNSAQLAPEGIRPSEDAAADVVRQASARAAQADAPREERQAQVDVARAADRRTPAQVPAMRGELAERTAGDLSRPHHASRYDARPPWSNPDTWWFRCNQCGRDDITGAELKSSPIIHIVPVADELAASGERTRYVQYGGPAELSGTPTDQPAVM